jgi:soluble lytic murein transglycosylase-like protein
MSNAPIQDSDTWVVMPFLVQVMMIIKIMIKYRSKFIFLGIGFLLIRVQSDASEIYYPINTDNYCFESAAESFGVDPEILQAISYVESRLMPSALNANTNGTVDYGHMQINSLWVSEIGLTYTLLDDPCFCTKVGAWILSGCIDKYGYNSNAISCYNSGRPLSKLSGKQRKKTEAYVRKVEKVFKILKDK